MRDLGEGVRRKVRPRQISADLLHEKQALRARGSGVYGASRKPPSKGLRKGDQGPRGLARLRPYLERAYSAGDTQGTSSLRGPLQNSDLNVGFISPKFPAPLYCDNKADSFIRIAGIEYTKRRETAYDSDN
jgi:hypothetical protein